VLALYRLRLCRGVGLHLMSRDPEDYEWEYKQDLLQAHQKAADALASIASMMLPLAIFIVVGIGFVLMIVFDSLIFTTEVP
jgi:hypothetical protein